MLSGRGLCDELITRPEESYRLCYVIVCDLETSRMGASYIYDISRLTVNVLGKDSSSIREKTQRLLVGNMETGIEATAEKTRYRINKITTNSTKTDIFCTTLTKKTKFTRKLECFKFRALSNIELKIFFLPDCSVTTHRLKCTTMLFSDYFICI